MEEYLQQWIAASSRIQGGMNMLSKLFSGRKKFVVLASVVVVLGTFGAWIWAQSDSGGTLPLRVTALEAELSSIKVPVNGKWTETGPIKITLSNAPTQFVGQIVPRGSRGERTTARIIWPVSISAPLLEKLGLKRVEAYLVGVGKRLPYSNSLIAADFAVLRIPGLPFQIVIDNYNCYTECRQGPEIQESAFWQGQPGAELRGRFNLKEAAFYGQGVNARELKREAFKVASSLFDFPITDVEAFLDRTLKLQQENMHEVVIYIPELDYYQTSNLEGTATLRIGR